MAKYLLHGSYTAEGVKGIIKEGGSKRREQAEQLAKAMGGTVEALYFALGDNDVYIIFDQPERVPDTGCKWNGPPQSTRRF